MKQEELDALYEDLQVDIKPGRGNFKYVKSRYILDRMNKTFMGNWSTEVITSERIGDEVVVQVRVSILTEGGITLRWQDGYGSAKYMNGLEYGNVYKSAKSKAVKDAVKSYGLGLFLEEGSEDSGSGGGNSPSPSFSGYSSPSKSEGPPSFSPEKLKGSDNPTDANKDAGFVPPSFPSAGEKSIEFPPSFPGSASETPIKDAPKMSTPEGFPEMSAPSNQSFSAPHEKKAASPKMGASGPSLTMVQKVAIEAKIAARKISFKEYATEVFEALGKDTSNIPDELGGLNYADAMAMASFK